MSVTSPVLDSAWRMWQRTIDEMRAAIEATSRFQESPEHRAQAIHSLIEAQAMSYSQVIAPRSDRPRIFTATGWNPNVLGLGQPAADGLYSLIHLDGAKTYTLRGRLGEVCIMLIQVYDKMLGHKDYKMLGNYDVAAFLDDGGYAVTFSAEPPDVGHWIPLDPDSDLNFVLVRRFFGDWFDDMGEFELLLNGNVTTFDHADEAALARRITIAADFVRYLVQRYSIELYEGYAQRAGGLNAIYYTGGETILDIAGNPTTSYGLGSLRVLPGQALIVEQEFPDSAYWSFQLGDVWSRPLDHLRHQSDVNHKRAVVDSDGRVRAVISHEDPGVPNWMDPAGRSDVVVVSRNYRELTNVAGPTCTVVPFAELRDHLPAETPTITPGERAAQLEHRRNGFLHLYEGQTHPRP